MDVSVQIEGMDELLRKVSIFEIELKKSIRKLLQVYAFKITTTAKKNLTRANLPGFDEGRLRNSIMPYLETFSLSARVETNVSYAIYLHEGTGIYATGGGGRKTPWVYFNAKLQRFVVTEGMKANPFLIDAWNEHINDFYKDLKALITGGTISGPINEP